LETFRWVEIIVVKCPQRPFGRRSRTGILWSGTLLLAGHGKRAMTCSGRLLDDGDELLRTHLRRLGDDDGGGDGIKGIGLEAGSKRLELRVLGEQLSHTCLELGYLRELAILRLVLVEILVQRLSLRECLWVCHQFVDAGLEYNTSICSCQWAHSVAIKVNLLVVSSFECRYFKYSIM
jgi:hypothetical protein